MAYASKYGVARFLGRFIAFFGWLIVMLGLVAAVISIGTVVAASKDGTLQIAPVIALTPLLISLSVVIAGIVQVAVGQILRATVDTADNTRRMLEIMHT
ncbi:MAG: hypothetical protein U1E15_00720 [Hyphomicrobiales bacterium]